VGVSWWTCPRLQPWVVDRPLVTIQESADLIGMDESRHMEDAILQQDLHRPLRCPEPIIRDIRESIREPDDPLIPAGHETGVMTERLLVRARYQEVDAGEIEVSMVIVPSEGEDIEVGPLPGQPDRLPDGGKVGWVERLSSGEGESPDPRGDVGDDPLGDLGWRQDGDGLGEILEVLIAASGTAQGTPLHPEDAPVTRTIGEG